MESATAVKTCYLSYNSGNLCLSEYGSHISWTVHLIGFTPDGSAVSDFAWYVHVNKLWINRRPAFCSSGGLYSSLWGTLTITTTACLWRWFSSSGFFVLSLLHWTLNKQSALRAAAVVQLQGCGTSQSITAGHFNSFRNKAATSITTGQTTNHFQTGKFRMATAIVEENADHILSQKEVWCLENLKHFNSLTGEYHGF